MCNKASPRGCCGYQGKPDEVGIHSASRGGGRKEGLLRGTGKETHLPSAPLSCLLSHLSLFPPPPLSSTIFALYFQPQCSQHHQTPSAALPYPVPFWASTGGCTYLSTSLTTSSGRQHLFPPGTLVPRTCPWWAPSKYLLTA